MALAEPGIPLDSTGCNALLRSRLFALVALALLLPVPSLGVVSWMVFEPTRGTVIGQVAYAISKVWILILPLLWVLLVERGRIGFSPMRRGGLAMGATLGIVIGAVIVLAYWFIGRSLIDVHGMRVAAERNGIGTPITYLAAVAYLALINSLLEEYVWRWFVFRKLETLTGGKAAVIFSAFFFTLHHVIALKAQTSWSVALLGSLGVFIGGLAWSWCYLRYRSIWPGYISHLIADIAVFAIGWIVLFN